MRDEKIETGRFLKAYFEASVAGLTVLQRKQRELDTQFEKGLIPQKKFAVREYNIWVLATQAAPYYYDFELSYYLNPIIMQADIDYLKNKKVYPRYFLKLMKFQANDLESFFIT